mmetsp:Transcript_10099/g.30848  ORF Transcript_10099/g.30848 Transcript_10099/m.30848 type:complete len:305 (-) Transcript_10099:147-1061(-)
MVARKKEIHDGLTAQEREDLAEAKRLRSVAGESVLTDNSPQGSRHIPDILRDYHGIDIVKKNTQRKLKYLVLMPGALSLPSGANVGEIQGLNSPMPQMVLDFKTFKVRMHGSFVHPKNAIIALKPTKGKNKSVLVQDVFKSIIAFSEWSVDNPEAFEAAQKETVVWKTPEQAKDEPPGLDDLEMKEEVTDGQTAEQDGNGDVNVENENGSAQNVPAKDVPITQYFKTKAISSGNDNGGGTDNGNEEENGVTADVKGLSQGSARRNPTRSSRGKRPSFVEESDDNQEDDEDVESQDDMEDDDDEE